MNDKIISLTKKNFIQLLCSISILFPISLFAQTLFREEFKDLNSWNALNFEKIKKHSIYQVTPDPLGGTMLTLKSDAAASALVSTQQFSLYEYPIIRWRWKVEKLLERSDPFTKKGDDYPVRVYLVFKYDPDEASFFERIKYASYKALNGEYPPHSSISYVWSSAILPVKAYESPYTSRARMIPLRSGAKLLNQWNDEEVDAFKDYKQAFGRDPPQEVSLAIMTDSDNTKGKTLAEIKYIEVRSKR